MYAFDKLSYSTWVDLLLGFRHTKYESQTITFVEHATEGFEAHHRFAVGTSLLQIAIVLETVAAVLDRRSLWYAGMAIGAVGVLALANGFLGVV